MLQRPMFQAIMAHPALALELVVTGAHLSPLHGYTVREVEADGLPIVSRIESLLYADRDGARLKGAALQLQVLSHVVDERRPDWLLAPADREEALMLALCGAYLNIPVAHYGAGDVVVGNVDDTVRHAVSALSHLLLTTHDEANARLIRAGHEAWRVHTVGHAGLDRIRQTPPLAPHELARELGVAAVEPPYLVVVQHPLSSEIGSAAQHLRETLEAVAEVGVQAFITYPNSDAGSHQMIQVLEAFRGRPNMHVLRHIPDVPFINLLRGASALVGNSSLGLLEGPFLHLPVINVGNRQTARHHAENVVFVAQDRCAIREQVRAVVCDHETQVRMRSCGNPFGDGRTGDRVAALLAATPITQRLLNKRLGG
jgi:GDP/UDP-N,N'-diacetylbacillosamine 2-epimerase (hydrolysing)